MDILKQTREISFDEPLYPSEWKTLADAPQKVYAVGDITLLKETKLTIVGSRRTPAAILKHTANLAKELSQALCLVTGIADGGDSAVMEGAIEGGGKLICVLACGFGALSQSNLALLERVAKCGLILSPYAFEVSVRSFSYEYRNKLLATLGVATFVIGAGEKSGALITAKYAKKLNKEIFAFPYPPNAVAGVGCNQLLKTGGRLVENAEDIFTVFGIVSEIEKIPSIQLNETEDKLYQVVKEMGEGHASELAQKAEIPLFKARAILSSLEVKGLIVSLGANRYAVV
jgi:DNA processing protein